MSEAFLLPPIPSRPALDLLHLIALALVQGIAEFLPVGSHAHLFLLGSVVTAPVDPGTYILIYLGTVLAVAVYFRGEMLQTLIGSYQLASGRNTDSSRLTMRLFLGWIPAIAVGAALMLLGRPLSSEMSLAWLAWTMVGFGLLLFLADRLGMRLRRVEHMSGATAFLIGLTQAVALVPGAGRMSVTMTAARLFGFERTEAARYAMLIGIVPVLALMGWNAWELSRSDGWTGGYGGLIGLGIAFLASFATIAFLMQWLRRGSLAPFALYRVVLGAAMLYFVYT